MLDVNSQSTFQGKLGGAGRERCPKRAQGRDGNHGGRSLCHPVTEANITKGSHGPEMPGVRLTAVRTETHCVATVGAS